MAAHIFSTRNRHIMLFGFSIFLVVFLVCAAAETAQNSHEIENNQHFRRDTNPICCTPRAYLKCVFRFCDFLCNDQTSKDREQKGEAGEKNKIANVRLCGRIRDLNYDSCPSHSAHESEREWMVWFDRNRERQSQSNKFDDLYLCSDVRCFFSFSFVILHEASSQPPIGIWNDWRLFHGLTNIATVIYANTISNDTKQKFCGHRAETRIWF